MQRVHGPVQHYEWGDTTFLPTLLQQPADGRPWAELWLGTHPSGPAVLDDGSPLRDLTGDLPYLLKVLSAAQPLSLQTHPDRAQAEAGHAAGRYPDPNPKPELLCALTPFVALCGIRPVEGTLELLDDLGATELAEVVRAEGPGAALEGLYRGRIEPIPVIGACSSSDRPEARLVRDLDRRYPGQPSVAATLLLHLVHLEPGDAIILGAGNLHAYVSGSGIELMGASDNVIRGGLTTKPVDVDELLRIVDRRPLTSPVLARSHRYELHDAGVALLVVEPGDTHRATIHELAIGLDGRAWYLAPGESMRASVRTYVVTT